MAWNGSIFAVAWESWSTESVYVTAIDPSGRVAPALQLGGYLRASSARIAAIGPRFTLAYTIGWDGPRAAPLRCGQTEPVVPQVISPAPHHPPAPRLQSVSER